MRVHYELRSEYESEISRKRIHTDGIQLRYWLFNLLRLICGRMYTMNQDRLFRSFCVEYSIVNNREYVQNVIRHSAYYCTRYHF